MTATLTRRQFGQGAGALVLAFSLAPRLASGQAALAGQPASQLGSLANNRMLEAWLRINADGSATIFAGKVELGQGILDRAAADRRRGARPAVDPRRDGFRRHRAHAGRRLYLG